MATDIASRGPLAFSLEKQEHIELPEGFRRDTSKVFSPLQVGSFKLQHRIIHAALGRQRSAHAIESPLAAQYFTQRTIPGTLVISQTTTVSAESNPWPFASGLWSDVQAQALRKTIDAVHAQGGFWLQQLTHAERTTSPALVKAAWYKAGHTEPPLHGFKPVSSSDIGETGLNTHSGEPYGAPRPLLLEEIAELIENFKKTAERAVGAGADGFEILSGNGFLLDQFLHDNINRRTDQYGGSVENRARLILEIVDKVAEVVGYQRIGVRLSPFSNFHETDGSQPLEQVLYLSRQLILRGIAYLNVGRPHSSRNLGVGDNLARLRAKGIPDKDISLRQFRILTENVKPDNPTFTPTRLFGNGAYTVDTTILDVENNEVDGAVHGRYFISNPDLIRRVREGIQFTPYNRDTFYTHGSEGYLNYLNFGEEADAKISRISQVKNALSSVNGVNGQTEPKKVAIIGAGVSGILSASAFRRLGGFDLKIFEQKAVPGGAWAYEEITMTTPQFPAPTSASIDSPHPIPEGSLPTVLPRSTQKRYRSSPLYENLIGNIPTSIMNGDFTFKVPPPSAEFAPYSPREDISKAVADKAHEFDDIISYRTTVEEVFKLQNGKLRLTLRTENADGTDLWFEEEFDHLIVAAGHNSVPQVPDIEGLNSWKGDVRHSVTYRNPEEFKDKRLLIVGSSESAIDISLHSAPFRKQPIYISQKTPHPRYPTVFNRPGFKVVPTIKNFTSDSIVLSDNTVVTLDEVDTVVFATGYFYSYPFLNNVRPQSDGSYVPGLYQHIFDIYNPSTIAFIGVSAVTLTWLTWEKSAFIVALLWSGKIHLPSEAEQKKWESQRLKEVIDTSKFHSHDELSRRVLYFDDLNELAAEYLAVDGSDDLLLRSFPFEWMVAIASGGKKKKEYYGIIE